MDALWNLEDKWKLTTKDAVAFLACTSFLVTALCIATILKRRANIKISSLIHQEPCMEQESSYPRDLELDLELELDPDQPPPLKQQQHRRIWDHHDCVKKVLMSTVRWSRVSRIEHNRVSSMEHNNNNKNKTLLTLLGSERYDRCNNNNLGLPSTQISTSPVWQRPILMGEKCELPRFSGLILYDHSGRPLQQYAV